MVGCSWFDSIASSDSVLWMGSVITVECDWSEVVDDVPYECICEGPSESVVCEFEWHSAAFVCELAIAA